MKNIFKITAFLGFLLAFQVASFGQTQPVKTTLSQAMVAGQNSMVVASATGASGNWALIGRDLRRVTNVSGTTLTVVQQQGSPVAHPSAANVIFGALGTWNTNGTASGTFLNTFPTGTCSARSVQGILPKFVIPENNLSLAGSVDCLNGLWVKGTLLDDPTAVALEKACTVPIGSVALGSFGTSTTTSSTVEFTASVFVPSTFIATGITNLHGSAVDGTTKNVLILKDLGGVPLANSATAGTVAATSDIFQAIPFTATKIVIGPAYYGIGLQADAADVNGIRTVAASTFNNLVASGPTSVFGTVGTLAFPTTFTADLGPVACIYR